MKESVNEVVHNFNEISNIQTLRQADELRQLCWLLRKELFSAPGEVSKDQISKKNRLLKQLKTQKDDELVHYVLQRLPASH